MVRFAYRAGWRVLPEILADESPDFADPIKRSMFAASSHVLFAATHPDANARKALKAIIAKVADDYAPNHNAITTYATNAAVAAFSAADVAANTYDSNAAAEAADYATAESDYQEWKRGHTKDAKDSTEEKDSTKAPRVMSWTIPLQPIRRNTRRGSGDPRFNCITPLSDR